MKFVQAGIESFIPPDQVIDAMYQIGINMPSAVRETAEGGLPAAPRLPAGRKPAEESDLSPQKPETNTN